MAPTDDPRPSAPLPASALQRSLEQDALVFIKGMLESLVEGAHLGAIGVVRGGIKDVQVIIDHVLAGEWPPGWKRPGQDDPPKITMDEARSKQIRDLETEVSKLRNAIWTYHDRPGCNPNSRRLALNRLLWAAGERT